jgi:hypothetical protein
MIWQDLVIAIANILMGYALIPQVYKGFRNKRVFIAFQTGLITTIALYVMGITLLTLKLYFSSIIALFNGIMWTILFIQTIIYR